MVAVACLLLGSCVSPPLPTPQVVPSPITPPPPAELSQACDAPGWEAQARVNEGSLATLPWAPFGRVETGWRVYAPLIGREIGVDCAPQSTGFARALAAWEASQGLSADGLMSETTFLQIKGVLQGRRPILMLTIQGLCPAPADEAALVTLTPEESLGEKPIRLRPGAADAYRRMMATARAEVPALAADPDLMKIFSAYRSPDYDAARCAAQNNCNGRDRAACSPHRTGLAFDLYLGHADGFTADSTADENRLTMTQSPAYRWMLANAPRFGFVNYPFEPWHWEWTGEAP